MPIQGFPISKWDDHPPNLKSVHGKRPRCRLRDEIDSFEEKALADILSPWKFCWFCRFGRGGLHLTSLIWHCFRRFHQMFVAVLICFCNMFLLLFFWHFARPNGWLLVEWRIFPCPILRIPKNDRSFQQQQQQQQLYFSQSYISLKGPFEVT